MAGQPVGDFDVTDIAVTWEKGVAAGNNLAILDKNEAFEVTVTFNGKGTQWGNMQNITLDYEVALFAEGIGFPPADINFKPEKGKLVAGQKASYEVVCKVPNGIAQEGVYQLSAMVTFPKWKGYLGFLEGLFIQVHDQEQQ